MGVTEREQRLQKIDQSTVSITDDIKKYIEAIIDCKKTFKIAEVDHMFVLVSQEKNKTLLTIRILNERKQLSKSLVDKLSKNKITPVHLCNKTGLKISFLYRY